MAGRLHESQGRRGEALECYRLAAEADPSIASPHVMAGRLHESQGRRGEALECYRLAAEADPSSADPHTAAGRLHESQGRRDEALECYRLAAEAAFPGTGTGAPASAFKEPGGIGGTVSSSGPAADTSGNAKRLDADSARILRRQGRLSDADGRIRYNKSSKGWRRNGQEG